jgi:hypothetical protein
VEVVTGVAGQWCDFIILAKVNQTDAALHMLIEPFIAVQLSGQFFKS